MSSMDETDRQCPTCGTPYGKRRRCYKCNRGGSPKAGEDRTCLACGKTFYVPRWKLNDVERNQGAYCSRACKHEGMRLNPVGTPRWARRLLSEYGLTHTQFETLLEAQGGVCAICGGPPNGPGSRLHVDHCHDSDRVRGLLCGRCNTAIGLLNEDPERFARAVEYLSKE